MPTHEFGGPWTADKLMRLRKYLAAYTKLFEGNPRARVLTRIYVDAFAGTGHVLSKKRRSHSETFLFPSMVEGEVAGRTTKGSAHIALEVAPSFNRYILIELKAKYRRELRALRAQYPDKADRIEIVGKDANQYLKTWCEKTDWAQSRAVVFLDPYGMQVEWNTIAAIAHTRAIDLWVLFPLGVAVNRLLLRAGPPSARWEQALTRMFGDDSWRQAFYPKRRVNTLFGEVDTQAKQADFHTIERFYVDRLKGIFAAVVDRPLRLYSSKRIPLYTLCFAVGNPRGAPTAIKIADHILGR